MKQTFNILIVLMLCLPTFMLAQNNGQQETCGTEFTPEMEARLLRNIETAKRLNLPSASRVTTYIAVKIHLVGDNDGSNRAGLSGVMDALCFLNQNYAAQDIVFYLAGVYDLDNTALNNHDPVGTAGFQMSLRKNQHNDAMNIFVCSKLNVSGPTSGTILGYYSPNYDVIAMRRNQMNKVSTTLTHEAGHFLSLPHPFNGWEGVDYHTTYSSSNPPPSSINGNLVELANGNNCATSGDYFCDTEADYNLGNTVQGCNYSLGAVDPTGTLINPDETLYMSYFDDNCQNQFTAEQQGAIAADLQTFQHAYIKGTPSSTTAVTTAATLTSPSNNGTTPFYDEVYLDWDDVPGADQYFIQISRTASFSIIVEELFTTGSSHTSQILGSGITYYWRVKAFNDVSICNNYSSTRTFKTSSFTVDTEEKFDITSIKLQPNVATSGQTISLNIQTEENVDATIRIINVSGQVMKSIDNVTFQTGAHLHQIETEGLTPGVYVLNLQTANGQINERFLITN